ncbi:MAG TPA: ATP-binding cassette domain-containing protein, partial [Rhabdochlamydiaceae bacterium]
MKHVVVAKNLSKSFPGIDLLKQISLEVAPGEAVAIMGKSGEGKSTLLHILGTLEAPSAGEIEIAGQPVRAANTSLLRNQHIGFIFQAFHLMEEETALSNVLMPAKIARKEKQ